MHSYGNGTYPDFIVHRRGKNDFNELVFEFKTWWNNDNLDDLYKVYQFVKSNTYMYKVGISIILEKEEAQIYLIYRRGTQIYGTKFEFIA